MAVIVTGSIATDYIMSYPGHFREHILFDEVGKLSVSFLVENKQMHRGGVGPNIAYSLALLGQRPRLMGTAGADFCDYATWLEEHGVDTSLVRLYADEFTSTFTVITDLDQNQIAGFHAGAMSRARELSFHDLDRSQIELVIIGANDPAGMTRYAAECQELGIPFIYDPSQQLARLSGEEVRASMRGARALAINDYELEMIRHKTGMSERDILTQVGLLVVTRGAAGSTLMTGERRVEVPAVPPAAVQDPTGGGDAYRAGLIVGLLAGYPLEVTGRIAALAATYVLEHVGTMSHHYSLPEFVARYRLAFGDTPELDDLLTKSLKPAA